ncbi:hypothetical protein A2574_03930 [Candidatus Shapirobacteria bacterium RIFOXYD1_FULL_38_32]|uniref:Uncharacterized protein n=1 Tax=Candidatus Shapirobacteria bacterium GW2011_GWE1_38_92 TaxID=1618489 RepID=A0A0G0LS72_9BACT|nr:MAG: hypothetical protein UT14_C0028G0010 [Candidatus Shapirobacteria bacterium GW2011_GWE1_38_92]OGL58346.1 MAG: hypothetical protein A2574_03930 [Candidatus Shapirobacteria bacterium RIFOXYD1_FULL_38_32]HAP37349.1 hypothetical protein [Candidatus Shapirobacteria bacterium]HCU55211.1 hypothetical protein [Candidatus Shapirobacteria bacterium]
MAEEIKIDNLNIGNYQENGREQVRMKGETAAIRLFDPSDREDMQRLRSINDDEKVKKWMIGADETSDKGIVDWANEDSLRTLEILFAISGTKEWAGKDEAGEAQGFVYCYPEEKERLENLVKEGILSEDEIVKPYEISYARNPESKEKQMASGVRQVCWMLNQIKGGLVNLSEPKMLVTVYVDPENCRIRTIIGTLWFCKKRGDIL